MLSICIVNWNTCERLRGCLRSIYDHPPEEPFEVLVADNASHDGSAAMVQREFPQVRLFANEKNLGYAEGNNQCLAAGRGEYLLLLNPDTEVGNWKLEIGNWKLENGGWKVEIRHSPFAIRHSPSPTRHPFDELIRVLRDHPEAAAVAPQLVSPDGSIQRSCRSFPTPGALWAEFVGLSRLFPRSRFFGAYRLRAWNHDTFREVDQPMGSCLLFRRAALDQVGRFDPQFRIFFNEVDLCYRLQQAGWKIYFTPDAQILHYGAEGTKQVRLAMVSESKRGLVRFYRKHYRGLMNPALYGLTLAAIEVAYALRYGAVWVQEWQARR